MENPNKFKLSRRLWAVQLALTSGLALLLLAVLPWGLQGPTPASADPRTLTAVNASLDLAQVFAVERSDRSP
jgi:hypothetical protein